MISLPTKKGGLARVLVALVMSMGLTIACATGSQCPGSRTSPPGGVEARATADQAASSLDYTKKLDGVAGIDQAVDKVRAALVQQGFGVVSDTDFQATMKDKLGVEMRPYRILGACNPKLAHQAIEKEKTVGILLPCKAAVYQDEDGSFMVSFGRPTALFELTANPELSPIAEEVDGLIRAAYDSL